jgi:hypothetical protein
MSLMSNRLNQPGGKMGKQGENSKNWALRVSLGGRLAAHLLIYTGLAR